MMFNLSEIVPLKMCMVAVQEIMKESCSLHVCDTVFLDIRVWEGDTASHTNFSEIWVLKLRV